MTRLEQEIQSREDERRQLWIDTLLAFMQNLDPLVSTADAPREMANRILEEFDRKFPMPKMPEVLRPRARVKLKRREKPYGSV